jgi:hypothetical protein
MMIWDAAFQRIPESPLIGYGFHKLNSGILDSTIDCVWLVVALRYGLPSMFILLLLNLSTLAPARPRRRNLGGPNRKASGQSGFTAAVLLFMVVGLTVDFWNFMWIFWGLCLGIRASQREWLLAEGGRRAARIPHSATGHPPTRAAQGAWRGETGR